MLDIPARCENCNQDFEIEPGFYSGALWTSYPLIIICIVLLLFPIWFFPEYIIPILILFGVLMFLLQPVFMRLGRAMWINIFVHYKK